MTIIWMYPLELFPNLSTVNTIMNQDYRDQLLVRILICEMISNRKQPDFAYFIIKIEYILDF